MTPSVCTWKPKFQLLDFPTISRKYQSLGCLGIVCEDWASTAKLLQTNRTCFQCTRHAVVAFCIIEYEMDSIVSTWHDLTRHLDSVNGIRTSTITQHSAVRTIKHDEFASKSQQLSTIIYGSTCIRQEIKITSKSEPINIAKVMKVYTYTHTHEYTLCLL